MIIFVDGSAHPNPGPGGYGIVVLDNNENLIYNYSKQYKEEVTNNKMELQAILFAMYYYGVKEANIPNNETQTEIPIVYSDSAYAVNVYTNWMFSWREKDWLKSDGNIPENLEIIQVYYELYQMGFRIDLQKIKGHSGNKWNNMADELATGKLKPMEIKNNE